MHPAMATIPSTNDDGAMGRRLFYAIVFLLAGSVAMLLLWPFIFYRIGPGQRGVKWTITRGTEFRYVYTEGLRAVAPWNALFIYDTRIREIHGQVTVLSSNGLPVTVTYSGRYRPNPRNLPRLHELFGPQYEHTLVRPEMISAIRIAIGRYRPEEIYARPEGVLLREMQQPLRRELARNYVVLHDLVLTTLRLTPQVEFAISDKLTREQQALAYEFRLRAEQGERTRKQIEAEGIAAFQRVAGVSILQWRGLEVTSELARSENAKVVILGTGPNNLPILLGSGPGNQ
jgi:regulator of protease activity HflC (stomatin/prohibitin superfamily)